MHWGESVRGGCGADGVATRGRQHGGTGSGTSDLSLGDGSWCNKRAAKCHDVGAIIVSGDSAATALPRHSVLAAGVLVDSSGVSEEDSAEV